MEKRVDEVAEQLEKIHKGYVHWARVTFWILVALVVVVLGTVGGGYYLVAQNHDRISDIQQSRVDSTLSGCQDQNFRRKRTIAILDKLQAKAKKTATPEQLAQIKTNRANTILFINALAPHRDCKLLVQQRFGKPAAEEATKK